MPEDRWIERYVECYFNPNPQQRFIGSQILHEHRPRKFCKYMGIFSAKKYLEACDHWCVHPNQYLYDETNSHTDRRDAGWYEFHDRPGMTENEREILEFYRNVVYDDPNNLLRSSLKVCSFTTDPLNSAMWDQYAENSRGICVEYDIGAHGYFAESLRNCLFPMIYRESPENLTDFVLEGANSGWSTEMGRMFIWYLGILISTLKDARYSWEDEWRFLLHNPLQANLNPIRAQFGTPQDMFSEEDEEDSCLPEDFVWGCYTNMGPIYPKNIYIGENISEELREKTMEMASFHMSDVYQVHRNGEEISSELIYTALRNH